MWDPAKAERNRRNHGVSFEMAREVFADPRHTLPRITDMRTKGSNAIWP